jgi:hypothetical protein
MDRDATSYIFTLTIICNWNPRREDVLIVMISSDYRLYIHGAFIIY